MRALITALLLCAAITFPAQAEEKKFIQTKKILGGDYGETKRSVSKDPFADVWNKYKELARENATPEEKSSDIKKPTRPTLAAQKKETAPTPGMGGILQRYQNLKNTRGNMQSKTITSAAPAAPAKEALQDDQ